MRKFLSLLLTMAMVLSLAVTVNAAAPKEDITILHTNDVHCDYEKYAKVATLHKSADLLVDAGDHVQGGVIGTLSKGEYIVDIMNYLKYDAAVPGNHEFDYGMDQFLHIAKDLAKYPYISANFTGKDGKPVVFPKLVYLYDERQIEVSPIVRMNCTDIAFDIYDSHNRYEHS